MHEESVFEGHWPLTRYLYVDMKDLAECFGLMEINGPANNRTPSFAKDFRHVRFQTIDSCLATDNNPCVISNRKDSNYSYKKSFVFYPSLKLRERWSFDYIEEVAVYLDDPIAAGVYMLANGSRKLAEYTPAEGIIGVTGYRMDPAVGLEDFTRECPFTFLPDRILELQIEIHSDACPQHLANIDLGFRMKVS